MSPSRYRGIADLGFGNADSERQHVVGPREAGMHVSQCLEAPDHQSGANEQHERERNLRDDERTSCAVSLAAVTRAAALLQRGYQVATAPSQNG